MPDRPARRTPAVAVVAAAALLTAGLTAAPPPAAADAPPATFPTAGITPAASPDDLSTPEQRFPLALSARGDATATGAPFIDLAGERFRVQVEWQGHQGGQGWGQPVRLSADSASFWFFRSSNVELVVKVLDGRPVNGHWWVFYGALSDVAYRVRVTDLTTGAERLYDNPPRHLASRGDARAFTADGGVPDGAGGPPPSSSPGLPEVTSSVAATASPCYNGDGALCLGGGRFHVSATWKNPRTGATGRAGANPLTGDSGYFWFFGGGNVELLVKVLDGRPVNGHHWVFFGSLTDVEFALRVEDTATREVRVYRNPGLQMASRGDTTAFAPGETPPDQRDFLARRDEVEEEAKAMTPEGFASRYPPPQRVESLSYDPLVARDLDRIVESARLSPAELARLADDGSVTVGHPAITTPESLYHDIYRADLPVLVTADSILYAVHRSYDALLASLERSVLAGEIEGMLAALHAELGQRLAAGALPPSMAESTADVDVYLTVARSLLAGHLVPQALPASAERAAQILAAAEARRPAPLNLFGRADLYDYSQLTPRGHYADDPVLEPYFEALMWLGRTELPLVTYEDGETHLERRAVDAALLLHDLLAAAGRERWERVNRVLEEMVGERDSMDPRDLDRFRSDLGLGSLAAAAATADATLLAALEAGDYGLQRIQSQILHSDDFEDGIVLPRVFLLLGQRFVIDSLVFHRLVFDRLLDPASGEPIPRMLPDPLDVQFSLGSNTAAELLQPEVDRFGHQGALHETRFLVESHPDDFWRANLYSSWLDMLRGLDATPEERPALPEAMRTRAWDLKVLNARLASWAELRHDTILYAKQSYTGGTTCEYPQVYLEPYPRFFAAVARYAGRGREMTEVLEAQGYQVAEVRLYFDNLEVVVRTLETIATRELAGEPLSQEERDFLRRTSEWEFAGCGPVQWDGWYPTLFFDREKLGLLSPTVADVHTAPTDESGVEVGWVLHAATGGFRQLVVTVEDCTGAQAYVGPVSTYYEYLGTRFERLDDERWLGKLLESPSPVPWLDEVPAAP
jgi:hypothetical protein